MEWLKLVEYGRPTVTVVISIDDNYVPLAAAMLASLADNADRTNVYEIVILDCGISDYKRSVLDWFLARHPHLAVRYVAIGNALEGFHVSRHVSLSTYGRLLIPELLPEHEKVIYLDADLIVLKDVSALLNHTLTGSFIAAATNCVVLSGMHSNVKEYEICHSDYLRKILGLNDDEASSYFNAGVLVLNNREIQRTNLFRRILTEHRHSKFAFWDQDMLNLAVRSGRVPLDIRWNIANTHEQTFVRKHPQFDELVEARKEPFIIHYTIKPWEDRPQRFSEYFWYYLRTTPFSFLDHRVSFLDHRVSILDHRGTLKFKPICEGSEVESQA